MASVWTQLVLAVDACCQVDILWLRLRKGRVKVWVSVPSEGPVRRFARHVAEAVSDEV